MDSFARVAASRDFAMEYLYARLFVRNPELRSLFPLSMEHTRVTTFGMLARLISNLHDPHATEQLLDRLGRDHRKFGVKDAHYQPFFDALLATVEQVSGPAFTQENSRAWSSVLGS